MYEALSRHKITTEETKGSTFSPRLLPCRNVFERNTQDRGKKVPMFVCRLFFTFLVFLLLFVCFCSSAAWISVWALKRSLSLFLYVHNCVVECSIPYFISSILSTSGCLFFHYNIHKPYSHSFCCRKMKKKKPKWINEWMNVRMFRKCVSVSVFCVCVFVYRIRALVFLGWILFYYFYSKLHLALALINGCV